MRESGQNWARLARCDYVIYCCDVIMPGYAIKYSDIGNKEESLFIFCKRVPFYIDVTATKNEQ